MKTKIILAIAASFVLSGNSFAVLFGAADKAFTIDLPSSWIKINPQGDEVLSLKRDASSVKISIVPNCAGVECIETEMQNALDFVKSKKFKILENTYSGEIIKRTEFSTGDPLLSFNYSGAAVDFTTAYFLADGKAYYAGIKGIPYVEADLILSFISPAPKPTNLSAGAAPVRIFEEPLVADIIEEERPGAIGNVSDESKQSAGRQSGEKTSLNAAEINMSAKFILFVITLYLLILFLFFALRIILPQKDAPCASNPRSGYPVKGERLYGSPDLFFRLYDNQGNNFIAVSSRWGDIFIGLGIIAVFLFFPFKFFANYIFAGAFFDVHKAVANTIISLSVLFCAIGALIAAAGLLTDMIFSCKYFFYDNRGAPAFKCVQKGFYPFREEYIVIDAKSASVLFRLRRARLTLRRRWVLYDDLGEIALILERSFLKAFLRLLFGHLCGFLRADYKINGRFESSGTLLSSDGIFTRMRAEIDKPEAIRSDIMLIACAVIFVRDRDKWHPWIN
ncbi:MAG: hypothetical protein LBG46_05950 [Elusimicrobiota bacterium]|nr:hypothetical protein [Elusimicrobiota bacterium]